MKKKLLLMIWIIATQSLMIDSMQKVNKSISGVKWKKLATPKNKLFPNANSGTVLPNVQTFTRTKNVNDTFIPGVEKRPEAENRKIQSLQKMRSLAQYFSFGNKQKGAIPSTGYFTGTISGKRGYVTQKSEKSELKKDENKKTLTIDTDNPKSAQAILDIIKTWKPIREGAKTPFFSIVQRNVKKAAKNSLAWLPLIVAGATLLSTLDSLYTVLKNKSKKDDALESVDDKPKETGDAIESKEPLEATEDFYRYPEKFFVYGIDGEMASTMAPKEFVQELQKQGLTVADAVAIQCQMQEQEAYKEITRIANLSDHDWNLLQNILKLRKQFLKGHYDENNVIFEGTFNPQLVQMIKAALERADIPFKVTVIDSSSLSDFERFFEAGNLASVSLGKNSNVKFTYHMSTGSAGIVGDQVDVKLYVSDDLKSDTSYLDQQAAIAHEVTHILNLDSVQFSFFRSYLENIKKADKETIQKCNHILKTIFEFRADVFILRRKEDAWAQKNKFEYHDYSRPDLYVQPKKMYDLASRTLEFHRATEAPSEKSWIGYLLGY